MYVMISVGLMMAGTSAAKAVEPSPEIAGGPPITQAGVEVERRRLSDLARLDRSEVEQ